MKKALRDVALVLLLPILWVAYMIGVYVVSVAVEDAMGWVNGNLSVPVTIMIGFCAGGAAIARIARVVLALVDKDLDLWK